MQVYLSDIDGPVDFRGALAAHAEEAGYAGIKLTEIKHDPFLLSLAAANATNRISIVTSIAVAFARNPMTLAVCANDIALASGGRFELGLGTQIKPHITRRFSMPWSHPAARMRECVLAIRTIWDAWATGEPLRFEGEFYTHTLMTPMFDPGPNPHGTPPIWLAAVGDAMTEVAGEVADGLAVHSFTTERYLREVTLPALARGRTRSGRDRTALSGTVFTVTGRTPEQLATARTTIAERIAFYASTPAYRPVLEMHGQGPLQSELQAMSKRGEWQRMGELVDDDLLGAVGVVGEPEEVAAQILARYGDLYDRVTLYTPYDVAQDDLRIIRETIQKGS